MQSALPLITALAQPVLQITGARHRNWCRNTKDSRRGPWRYEAIYDVLDADLWARPGHVLYLVTDAASRLRMVGESIRLLKSRWRESPMHDVVTKQKIGRGLFHSTAWPAIEAAFDAEQPPFIISAIFGDDLKCLASDLRMRGFELPDGKHPGHSIEKAMRRTLRKPLLLWNRN